MTLAASRVTLLDVAGLGLLSSAAWVLHVAAGLAVAGVACLLLGRAAER